MDRDGGFFARVRACSANLALSLTNAETRYRTGIKLGKAERATCIQTGFVPKFRQEELSAILSGARLSRRQRELLFDWVDVLFEDLQGAPANRGACLDGIATVIERSAIGSP